MDLALEIFIILLVELPIIMLFFKQKKRRDALGYAIMINLVSWPIVHILKLTTELNVNYIEAGVIIFEAVALLIYTKCGWKKGFSMSVIANIASFFLLKLIHINPDMFQNASNIIVH